LDPVDRGLEDTCALHGPIMRIFQPVEMDIEEKTTGRPELVQTLLDEHAVGAKVDVLALSEDLADQPADLRVDHGLAAADADDGGSAFVHRLQAFGDAQFV